MKRFQAIAKGRFALLRNRRASAAALVGDMPAASVELSALTGALQSVLQGSHAAGLIPALREFIADEQARILQRHRNGETGQAVVQSITTLTDAVVTSLFQLAEAACDPVLRRSSDGCALIALGGYGRREMNPGSDVDLMFVYPRRADAYLNTILHPVLSTLWDVGFVVGHCCRSIDDCVRMAQTDLTSRTSMMEARYLAGKPEIYQAFSAKLERSVFYKHSAAFVKQKLQELRERHYRYGASIYVQEPHIKEGPGSLRDLHAAMWIARITQRAGAPSELAQRGLLSQEERERWDLALDFMLRLRNELHYLSRGKNDVLSLSTQEQVAANLGFLGTDGSYGVEQFMQRYYLAAKDILQLSQQLIVRCTQGRSQVEMVMQKLRARDIGDDLTEIDRCIHVMPKNRGLFQEDPVRLLKVFWYAQQMGYTLSQEIKDYIKADTHLIDDGVRRSSRALGFLLAILREPKGVAATLRSMHELGVLGSYMPEFAKLTRLVQFDFYHRYTVDEHTFLAIETLEHLDEVSRFYGEEFRSIASDAKRLEILRLALLLHDIGKGEGPDHVPKGTSLVEAILARMGIPEQDADTIRFLVVRHLEMSHIAQRLDLDDEAIVIDFAKKVQTLDRLKMLYLLTYGDIKAVGPGVWTEWKGTLLWELYIKTHTILTRGIPEGEDDLARAERVKSQLTQELSPEFGVEAVKRHLHEAPARYLLTTPLHKVASHMRLIQRVQRGEEAASQWTAFPLAGYSEFTLCAYGRHGRFAHVVGTLTANGINILSAQIFTLTSGMVIRNFRVDNGGGAAIEDATVWDRVVADLRDVLAGRVAVRDLIKSRRKAALVQPIHKDALPPTKVEFDNVVSEAYTVLDVRTRDRLGLLYLISSTLSELGVDLRSAKIMTEAEQVVDVFYVTNKDGSKLMDEARREQIRRALEHALSEGFN
ncbi:[protein-PII] uridylyltransferase [Candidatus Methylomirabilis sp.]|uniref:[protein-PII] uridylyltransferase n=1 Tax=Candidatus Methylomirabilis sp. TaxID=2032687 RepID=UPI002A657FBA|nr:[protein-PII] uridylyltransferase [Candidatus Methylomirabilis sp.]